MIAWHLLTALYSKWPAIIYAQKTTLGHVAEFVRIRIGEEAVVPRALPRFLCAHQISVGWVEPCEAHRVKSRFIDRRARSGASTARRVLACCERFYDSSPGGPRTARPTLLVL